MSRLAEIQDDLQEVSSAIAHAERTAAEHPNMPSVLATLRTIQKRRENLEEQFAAAADEVGLDLCSYRIEFEDRRQATISAITVALNSFQKIFTLFDFACEQVFKHSGRVPIVRPGVARHKNLWEGTSEISGEQAQ